MPRAKKTGPFGPELFDYLRRLDRNNDRVWFENHKQEYLDHVRDPLLRFIAEFGPHLGKVSRHFLADPRPVGGSMFRIYRDVRFSKDKRPYKTAASAQFRHERGKDVHAPGFYLHLAPGEVFAGAGLWHPDAAALGKIRQAMIDGPAAWKRVSRGKAATDAGLALGGESLKRPPRGFDPEHPLIEDLKRKDFVVFAPFDEATACRPDFLERFTGFCRASRPFVRFLTRAVELEF